MAGMAGADGGRRRADEREGRRRRARAGRVVLRAALVLAAGVVLAAGWVAGDALRARAHLQTAARQLPGVEAAVLSGDDLALDAALTAMQDRSATAVAATRGPHWWLAARVPGVGPSVSAVQTVSEVVHALATEALPTLADAADVLDPATLAPRGGRVDLAPLEKAAPTVVAADEAVRRAVGRLDGIAPEALLPGVAEPVERLRESVEEAALTTATASRAARLLPPMLGAGGPRRYLLMVQSAAEIRSTGGFPGALVLITADDGVIRLEQQVASRYFRFDEPVLPLTAEEESLYTERIAVSIYGTTITPDYPRAAELAREMWRRHTGQGVDGVLTVDPVVLERVLAASGPVRTPSGVDLTGNNAARLLLNEVYVTMADPADHDVLFAEAASAVFTSLVGGEADAVAVLPALAESAAEGRVLVWSAHQAEQDLIADTVLSGRLRGEDDGAPVIGVYLNDGSMAKISYYLDYTVRADRIACLPDGRREIAVSMDLTSRAPENVADLPPYVAGLGHRVPPGVARTNVAVYAPADGWIERAALSGVPTGVASYSHDGLQVVLKTVDLSPGESTSLEVTVVTAPDQPEAARLRVTPGARAAEHVVSDSPCER